MLTNFDFASHGKKVLDIEAQALCELKPFINENFNQACRLILECSGKIIVMGMGKSGHIGCKIAATLASTGTPSFFVHPGEASHGDLGMISNDDIVLAISNSGESHEILTLIPVLRRRGITIISMSGKPESNLAKCASVNLQIKVEHEACPLGLAPTSSTTATLAMGDALAISLLQAKGFTKEDFALSHPGGSLGRKLLLRISDIMHCDNNLPQVNSHASIRDALFEITKKGLGMTAVVNSKQEVVGIFTDGDLRRLLDNHKDIHSTKVYEVMSQKPTTVTANILAAEALNIMQEKRINALLVVENKLLVGALNMHDLLQAGVI